MTRQEIVEHIAGGNPVHGILLRVLAELPDRMTEKFGDDGALLLLDLPTTLRPDDVELDLRFRGFGTTLDTANDVLNRGLRLVVWGTLRNWEVTKDEAEAFYRHCANLPRSYFVELAMRVGRYN